MRFQRIFGHAFSIESTIAEVILGLILATLITAFVLSWIRKRRGKPPSRNHEMNRLEVTYATVVALVVGYLVYLSFSSNHEFYPVPDHTRTSLTVRVVSFQWCWNFQYEGTKVSVSDPCAGGPIPTLMVPAGRAVRMDLTSVDVIHAFWVPALRVKLYAYPDHLNHFTWTLKPGRWLGHCAEFCGLYHDDMMFWVKAVPAAQFDRWLHAQEAHGSQPVTAGGGA